MVSDIVGRKGTKTKASDLEEEALKKAGFRKYVEIARKLKMPEHLIQKETDELGLMVAIESWKHSPERHQMVDKERRTPEHEELLHFIVWALERAPPRTIPPTAITTLKRLLPSVRRGDKKKIPFVWLREYMHNLTESKIYKPRTPTKNLKREKAPWG